MRNQCLGARFLTLCLIAAITSSRLYASQKYAVVIGVSKYRDYGTIWLQYADRDADLFKSYLQKLGIPPGNVAVVKDELATTASMRENIRHVLDEQAGAGDDVYIFFSARGLATHYYRGGFVLGYLSRLDHPISTALTTDDLEQLVQQTKANVYVFADLARDPPGPQPENNIQLAMKSVWQIHPTMSALLASNPGQLSLERKDLDGGHGVFGYYLVKELGNRPIGDRKGEVTIEDLFRELQNVVPQSTDRKQSPLEFVPQKGTSYRQQLRPTLIPASYRTGNQSREPGEQSGVDTSAPAEFWLWARRSSPDEMIARYRTQGGAEQKETRRNYEIALEDKGEEVFASFGDCIECLEESDPDRLVRRDYELGRRSFELAGTLTDDQRLKRMLDAKRQFCEGRVLTVDKKYSEAEAYLKKAITAFPEMPELHNALGIAYFHEAKSEPAVYQEALSAFQKSVDESQDWAYARDNLAISYIRTNNYSAAEREYREAIVRAPYEPYLYLNLALLLHQQGRYAEAVKQYAQALDVSREQQRQALNRKQAWESRRDDPMAAYYAGREAALDQTWVLGESEIHNALGALQESQANLPAARRELEEALRLNPQLLIAKYQLARLNYETADGNANSRAAKTAVQEWQSTIEEKRDYGPSHLRLAEAYTDQKKFGKAADEYGEVLTILDSPVIRALQQQALGDAALRNGNTPRACSFYNEAVADVETADGSRDYRDLTGLQNSLFLLAAAQDLPANPSVKEGDFFQPCRWNREISPNEALDVRYGLFCKIRQDCHDKSESSGPPTTPYPIPQPPTPVPYVQPCSGCETNTTAAPEPGTFWLAAIAVGAAIAAYRRKRRNS